MELKHCIAEIINNFEFGISFDSHTIIEEILNKYPDVYNDNFSDKLSINQYHGIIAKIIGTLDNVEKSQNKSCSHTINNKISPDASWIKISK